MKGSLCTSQVCEGKLALVPRAVQFSKSQILLEACAQQPGDPGIHEGGLVDLPLGECSSQAWGKGQGVASPTKQQSVLDLGQTSWAASAYR